MRGQIIFLVLVFLIIFNLDISTGETIHGKATKGVGMNITITAPPSLTMISPKNQTYLNNITILLNYSSDAASVNYSLDSGTNITITSSIFFNASEGNHNLSLYALNSQGITIKSVNFSIDSALFNISHSKWKGDTKGNSTNFTIISYQEIQNFSNVTFEHTSYGKIRFNQNLNLTDDADVTDNEIDLYNYINISSKKIELNSTALPNFDKKATLWLYGLSFTDPRILIDGEACPSAICKKENYSGGTLIFNVTGFTVYSVDETPTTTTTTTTVISGGGGGYSSRITQEKGFILNTDEIKISVKQGQVITKNFIITNQDNKNINIKINELKIEDLVLIQEQNFSLGSYQSKIISFDVFAREDTLPKLYLGKVIISSESTRKELLVGIEVESKKSLFDIQVEISRLFLPVTPGNDILAEIKIFNLGFSKREDISLEYIITDYDNNRIIERAESLAVETQASFIKRINIPKNTKTGQYVFYVKIIHDGEIASASESFEVVAYAVSAREKIFILVILLLIIIISIFIYYLIKKREKSFRIRKKVNIEDIIKR